MIFLANSHFLSFRRYVEKLEFLERADHRRFEMEKEAREKTRKTFNR